MVDEPITAPRSRLKEAFEEAQSVFRDNYDDKAYELEYADYVLSDDQFDFSFDVVPKNPRLITDKFEIEANGSDVAVVEYVDATDDAPSDVTFSVNGKEVEKSHDTRTSLEIVSNITGEIVVTVLENEEAGKVVLRAVST